MRGFVRGSGLRVHQPGGVRVHPEPDHDFGRCAMTVSPVTFDAGDAVELGELLEFLDRWLASGEECLAGLLARFVGVGGYELEELRSDVARFAFLLGGIDGDAFIGGGGR
jgi:hypothetical protein